MRAYVIRWRGRTQGPLTLEQINALVDSGRAGLLTEINMDGRWITLREFYKQQQAADLQSSVAPELEQPTAVPGMAAAPPQVALSATRRWRGLLFATAAGAAVLVLAGAGIVLLKGKARVSQAEGSASKSPSGGETTSGIPSPATPPVSNGLPVVAENESAASNSAAPATPGPSPAPQKPSRTPAPEPQVSGGPPSHRNEPASIVPLPENEPRTFQLKNGTNYTGTIAHVDKNGLIIKYGPTQYSLRQPWDLFEETGLEREPKVLAYRKAERAAAEAAERKEQARREEVERQRLAREEEARRREEFRKEQDRTIERSIRVAGWRAVTSGHLKAWGTEVTIGDIFAVVAPRATWASNKLADHEPERYTHYLVEARWTNDKGERVAMQYLVTADGNDFRLHGCFVSGTRMPDYQFLVAVKELYERKR